MSLGSALRKVPVEVTPLIVVLSGAVTFAFYSMGKKIATDRDLRLYPSHMSGTRNH
ncbi:NADH dehydrogenase 1 alpha subcomplex subunit 4 [Basidiobolus meristosporus CBS 931.73]|uniref:NADH dehydrogenase 1 alpha subcomplex subunit 4 n=1 Tax=Basidiobolus meristosporus CBS 931.73 TaxID=1314790 RepID=A0A1Y1XVM2_9FUNG|nr:NADH dehydrogenase 1 alpha subcomplex subunit 4 [Basidiobolus meristosporus CBS 931.73]|eukprot:ORX89344.1 NADH dehydrogenase 1 alpha subcomplex subunit 4 [Basidiobolus meristosporus CBS 931.73]